MNKDKILRKSNSLVFSRQDFSGVQRNFIYQLLATATLPVEDVNPNMIYEFTFYRKDIPRINDTEMLKQELEAMTDRKISWLSDDREEFGTIVPFPSVEYDHGEIKIGVFGKYLSELLELKVKDGYSVFSVLEMFSLNGRHPKRLFEMFSSYKNRNIKRFEIEVKLLKKLLGIEHKYEGRNTEFYKVVILPAVKQINEKTSVNVTTANIKGTKRKPAEFVFDVEREVENPIDDTSSESKKEKKGSVVQGDLMHDSPLNDKQQKAHDYLVRYGFTSGQAYNCVYNEKAMKLFYQWHYTLDKNQPYKNIQTSFFKQLKDSGLKI
jgi:plasmid replication initiation protein